MLVINGFLLPAAIPELAREKNLHQLSRTEDVQEQARRTLNDNRTP
jgi:hypothetical protein